MVGSGSSNPLESNLKFNGARCLSPLSLLGGGIQQGLPYWMSEGSFSDSGQTTLLAWLAPAACVGTSRLQGIPHKPSQHSTFLDGPALHKTVDGFVMSYLLICSWRLSFPLQVLSFPSLLFIRKSCGLPKSFLC